MKILLRWRALFRKEKLDAEMSAEMREHLESQTRENIAHGMAPDEARYAAQRSFGGVEQIKERCREQRGGVWIDQVFQDLRYAARGFARSPGFTSVMLVSLALGIGANTAIFSLLDTVLWKMLPVAQPEQLVFLERFPIRSGVPGLPGRKFADISHPLMRALVDRGGVLVDATTFWVDTTNAIIAGQSEPVKSIRAADNFFDVLGVAAVQGRALRPGDGREGGNVVLSHGYWQRRFGGKDVVGSSIVVNGRPHTIIGVAAPEFFGLQAGTSFDVLTAMSERELAPNPGASVVDPQASWLMSVVARLRPGVSLERANDTLTALLRQLSAEAKLADVTPDNIREHRIEARPASRGLDRLRSQFSKPLFALLALVAIVLLITCANLANLLLARATARQRELAIRLAMGASRPRLIRQMLTESVLLALAGGALGLFVARGATEVMLRVAASGANPIALTAPLDLRALGFTTLVAIATGLVFGLVPAWAASSGGAGAIFGRAVHAARPTTRLGQALVVAQVALSLVVLFGAGLLVRSFEKLTAAETGFRRENLLLVSVDPRLAGRRGAEITALYVRMLERVSQLPGVITTTIERNIPLSGASTISGIFPAGFTPPPGPDGVEWSESVGPRYFETLGIRRVAGRDFASSDDHNAPKVVALNETAARLFFPGQNPIGLRIGGAQNRAEYEVIAVVADIQHATVRERPRMTVYLPVLQDRGIRETTLFVRTSGDPEQIAPQVRAALREVDSTLPILRVTTLEQVMARSLVQDRLTATLGSCFSVLTLVLAGVGIAGLLSFAVARRTSEIGLRMALGADRRDVIGMIVREALTLVLLGIGIGLPCALVASRAVNSLLFGLTPSDPGTLAGASTLLMSVAVLAAFWPARRAAAVDPLIALRAE